MKNKPLLILFASVVFLTACAPAVVEEAPAPEVMEVETMQVEPTAEAAAPTEAVSADASMGGEISFSQDILPVLEQFANPAHVTAGRGGVFLATYEDVVSHVVPGNPEESELYRRLTGDGVPVMPPSGKLPNETIQLFYDWIQQGAKNN